MFQIIFLVHFILYHFQKLFIYHPIAYILQRCQYSFLAYLISMHSLLKRIFILLKRIPFSWKRLVNQKLKGLLPPTRTWHLLQKPIEFFLVLVYKVKQLLHMLN